MSKIEMMLNQIPSILFAALFAAGCGLAGCGPSGGSDTGADAVADVADVMNPDDSVQPDADARDAFVPDTAHETIVTLDGTTEDTQWPDTPPIDVNDVLDNAPLARFINPFIGTQAGLFNVGNTFPGPGVPFGMVRLSPDTGDQYGAPVYTHCGGYLYNDPMIYGFSHNHLHGTGAPDYGDVLVMPATAGGAKTKLTTFAAEYDKSSEHAEAGYYTVTLKEPDVKVELTATTRCGYHRYTWPQGTEKGIITVDYGASLVEGRSLGGQVVLGEDGIYDGLNYHLGDFAARFGGYDVYFAMRFDRDSSTRGVWHDGAVTADTGDIIIPRGEETKWGGWFEFDLGDDPIVELQVCLSYSSAAGARANMAAELPEWNFNTKREHAFSMWEGFVDKFVTVGGDLDRKVNFYTALYHSAQMPQIWSDVNGDYQGFDKAVHNADGWNYYTDLSLWDTFRTQQPLIALVWPEVHRDINRSMLEMAQQSGNLPKWALAAGDTGSMIGQHAATIVADSYLKGITDFDVDTTFDYLKACAEDTLPEGVRGRRDSVPAYNTLGYIPADQNNSSVSVTLEYAFCDFCLAELAGAIGRTEDEAVFRARALNYRNVWDPELKFFRERNADGSWTADPEDFDPTIMTFGGKNQGYTEGSGWQYRWFAPHDPQGLIELYEGVDSADDPGLFVTLLNQFFQNSKDTFNFQVPTGMYYHGNEPDIHAAFMFINAGRPDLAQYWSRWILDTSYRNAPEGLVGNDDAGTLAAWYVFAASGLYPSPCLPGYFITTPAFDSVVIALPGGEVVINAPGAADGLTPYIAAATIDGVPMDISKLWVTHEDLADGATIELTLSATP